jgi:hypothetical protein
MQPPAQEQGIMSTTTKRQVIESLLENESLTDGLSDEYAQRILQWCVAQVEAFQDADAHRLVAYGQRLAQQARTVSRIAQHILVGETAGRIHQRLQLLTTDPLRQQRFLALLKQDLPLQDYIDALLRLAEGH